MVDATEVVLNIAGWVVAGGVTVAGILIVHALEERSRMRQEDLFGVHEPVHREMESILEDEPMVRWGGSIWTVGEDYRDVIRRGSLRPTRHDALRTDLETLQALEAKHTAIQREFWDARVAAAKTALQESRVRFPDISAELSLPKAVGLSLQDDELLSALAAGDRNRWIRRLERERGTTREGVKLDWVSLRPTPVEMFERANSALGPARSAYLASAKAVLDQARRIRDGLDEAIRRDKAYGGRTDRRKERRDRGAERKARPAPSEGTRMGEARGR